MSYQRYFQYFIASAIAAFIVIPNRNHTLNLGSTTYYLLPITYYLMTTSEGRSINWNDYSIQSHILAQTKLDTNTRLDKLPIPIASPWENAVLTRTLESATKINNIRFSPNGKILASVGASQVTLWQLEKGEIQRILPGHYATKLGWEIAPTAIAFSPDSSFLATATWSQGLLSPDSSLVVWDIATGEKVLSLQDSQGCRQVLFDVKGEILYGACDVGVSAWSFPGGKKLFSLDTGYPIETIALHPQGKAIATVEANISGGQQGEQSNQIQLWQIGRDGATLLNTLDGHVNEIAQLEFTANGKKLVSSSYDGKINVWNWQQGTIDPKTNNIYSKDGLFSLSADSRLIAGNFHSSTIADLVTGLPLRNVVVLPKQQQPQIVAFSPADSVFAQVKESQIYLWQTEPQPPSAKEIDSDCLSLPIAQYWEFSPTKETTKPSPIGKDRERDRAGCTRSD